MEEVPPEIKPFPKCQNSLRPSWVVLWVTLPNPQAAPKLGGEGDPLSEPKISLRVRTVPK